MMKKLMTLLLTFALAGCSSSWVSVSDNKEYSFYQNGKLVCESTNSCEIGRSSGKEMVLEARKDDIVYGHIVVAKEGSKHGNNAAEVIKSSGGIFKFIGDMCGSSRSQADIMVCLLVGGGAILAVPIALVVSLAIPDHIGEIPANLTIPVGAGADSVAAFPWDQPARD
jgi:hypothetical protein